MHHSDARIARHDHSATRHATCTCSRLISWTSAISWAYANICICHSHALHTMTYGHVPTTACAILTHATPRHTHTHIHTHTHTHLIVHHTSCHTTHNTRMSCNAVRRCCTTRTAFAVQARFESPFRPAGWACWTSEPYRTRCVWVCGGKQTIQQQRHSATRIACMNCRIELVWACCLLVATRHDM